MFEKYKNLKRKNFDYHLHTTYTDGKSSMREMAAQAVKLGYSSVAFTDHVRDNSDYLAEYFNEIDVLKKEFGIQIYKGIEARISDFKGNLSYPKNSKPEIIVASVHRISINDKIFKISDFSKEIAFEIEKLLALEAVKNGQCNVLGHCGGMCIHFYNEFPIFYFEEIIKTCADCDVAFEINSRYHKNFIKALEPILEKYNPYVTFGSDAHCIEDIRGIYE